MKLQPDRIEGVNAVTAVAPGLVRINAQAYTTSLVLPWRGNVLAWPCERVRAAPRRALRAAGALCARAGDLRQRQRLRFAAPALLRSLIERRIGIETMDTAAACRTYNVLAGEGRAVVAALLLERCVRHRGREPAAARQPV